MTSIFSGNGLGLFNSSANMLGGSSNPWVGQGGQSDEVFVNSRTGNLVIRRQDLILSGLGLDTSLVRTYNSQGASGSDGDNDDNWRFNVARLLGPTQGGAPITKRFGDGAEVVYQWDGNRALYVSDAGDGAQDTLEYSGGTWIWTDGDTQNKEYYNASGLLDYVKDTAGNLLDYVYNGAGLLVEINDQSQNQSTYIDYKAGTNDVERLRVVSNGVTQTSIHYGYDDTHRLTSVTVDLTPSDNNIDDGETFVTRYTYDDRLGDTGNHRVASIAHSDGTAIYFGYQNIDGQWRVQTYTQDGHTTTLNYTTTAIDVIESASSNASSYVVTSNDIGGSAAETWAKLALKLYGDSAAGPALQQAMAIQSVGVGTQLTRLPLWLEYNKTITVTDTRITDPLNQESHYYSDSAGRVRRVAGPSVEGGAQVVSFSYDQRGNVLRTQDANGSATHYTYDTRNNLIRTVDALGNTVVRTYSATNQLLTETAGLDADLSGNALWQETTTRYVYDAQQHLRFVISADGRVTEYQYGTSGYENGSRVATIHYADTLYNVSALAANASISLAQAAVWVDGINKLTTRIERVDYAYDFRGNVRKATAYAALAADGTGVPDPTNDSVTHYVYDQWGRLLQAIDARNTTVGDAATGTDTTIAYSTTYTYDGLGRLLTSHSKGTSSDAVVTTLANEYDDAGNRVITTLASGLATTQFRDSRGFLTRVAEADGTTVLGDTYYKYDAAGHLRASIDPLNNKAHRIYDAAGRLVLTVDASGAATEYVYDKNNNLIRSVAYATRLSAAQLSSLLDAQGNPADVSLDSVRPASDSNNDRVTRRIYDGANRLAAVLQSHDTDASQVYVARYFYDGAGRPVSEVAYAAAISLQGLPEAPSIDDIDSAVNPDADDRSLRSFYSKGGMLLGTLDGDGYLVAYEYDGAGRLKHSVRYAKAASQAVRDAASSPTADAFNLVKNDVASENNLDDRHDWLLYDKKGQLQATLNAEGYLSEFGYDKAGNRNQEIRYYTKVNEAYFGANYGGQSLSTLRTNLAGNNDAVTTWTHDGANRVLTETVKARSDSGSGTQTRYEYDAAGNLVRSDRGWNTSEQRTNHVEYDVKGRVTRTLSGEGSEALAEWLAYHPNATAEERTAQTEAIWTSYGTRYQYDANGQCIAQTHPNGAQTLFYYDQTGRKVYAVNSASGDVEAYRYNAFGDLTDTISYSQRIEGPVRSALTGGKVTTALESAIAGFNGLNADNHSEWQYNLRGAIKRALITRDYFVDNSTTPASIGAHKYFTDYTYNAFGELYTTDSPIDSDETSLTRYTRDHRGNVTTMLEDADNGSYVGQKRSTSAVYDAFGRVKQTFDGNNIQRDFSYDRLGRLLSVTGQSSATYDAFGRVLTTTDLLNHATTRVYNDATRSFTLTTPEGVQVTTTLNRHGEVIAILQNGSTTTYSYDDDGRLLQTVVDAGTGTLNLTQQQHYDASGRLDWEVDANGTKTAYSYDAANRLLSRTVDPSAIDSTTGATTYAGLNLTTSYTYDGQGRVLTETAPNNSVTRTTYYADGHVADITVDDGGLSLRTHFTYDSQGRTVEVTTGYGTNEARTTTYVYDHLGRRIEEHVDIHGLDLTTSYGYDGNDNVVRATDGNGNVTRFYYDSENRLTDTLDAENGLVRLTLDANGRVLKSVQYANFLTGGNPAFPSEPSKAQVDARVLQIQDPSKDRVEQFVYDLDGRLAFKLDAAKGVTEYRYDGNGQVVQTVSYAVALSNWPAITVSAASLAKQVEVLNHDYDRDTRFFMDGAGRVRFAVDSFGGVIEYTRDSNGAVVQTVRYAGTLSLSTAYGYTTAEVAALVNALDHTADRTSREFLDKAGRTRFSVDSSGAAIEFVRDANGAVIATVAYGQRLVLDSATSYSTTDIATAVGNLPHGEDRVSRAIVDKAGRVRFTIDALGGVAQFDYNANGEVIRTVAYGAFLTLDPAANYTVEQVAAAVSNLDHSLDQVSRNFLDDAGRVRFQIDGSGAVIEYGYDANGAVTKVVAYGEWLTLAANPSSPYTTDQIAALLSGLDHTQDRTSYTEFDALGRAVKTKAADGSVMGTKYCDALGDSYVTTMYATRDTSGSSTITATDSADDRHTGTRYSADGLSVWTLSADGSLTLQQQLDAVGSRRKVVQYASFAGYNWTDVSGVPALPDEATLKTFASSSTERNDDRTSYAETDKLGRTIKTLDADNAVTMTTYLNAFGDSYQTTVYASTGSQADGRISVSNHADDRHSAVKVSADGMSVWTIDEMGAVTLRQQLDAVGTRFKTVEYAGALDKVISGSQWTGFAGVPGVPSQAQLTTYTTNAEDRTSYVENDKLGRTIKTKAADGSVTSRQYLDALGESYLITAHATLDLSGSSKITAATNADDQHTAVRKSADGRRTWTIDSTGAVTLQEQLDALGTVTKTVQYATVLDTALPESNWAVFGVFLAEELPHVPSAASLAGYATHADDRTSYVHTDKLGRVVKTKAADGAVVGIEYADGLGLSYTTTVYATRDLTTGSAIALVNHADDRHTGVRVSADGRRQWTIAGDGAVTLEEKLDAVGSRRRTVQYATLLDDTVSGSHWTDVSGKPVLPSAATLAGYIGNAADRTSYADTDKLGRTVKTMAADGSVVAVKYLDKLGRNTVTTEHAQTGSLDANGHIAVANHVDDRHTGVRVSADGTRTWTIDAVGAVTLHERLNALGSQTKVAQYATLLDDFVSNSQWDDTVGVPSLPSEATLDTYATTANAANRSTTSYYDKAGRLTTLTDATGGNTYCEYDAFGNQTRVINPLFDVLTRDLSQGSNADAMYGGYLIEDDYYSTLLRQILNLGTNQALAYPLSTGDTATVLAFCSVSTKYDHGNQAVLTTDGRGTQRKYEYDAFGNVRNQYDALGTTDQTLTVYTWDKQGRLKTVTDAENYTTTNEWDAFGDKITVTRQVRQGSDTDAQVTRSTYDERGRLLTQTYGLATSANGDLKTVHEYDAFTLVKTTTSFAGLVDGSLDARVTAYRSDKLNRVTHVTDGEGYTTRTVYNVFGNTTEVIQGIYESQYQAEVGLSFDSNRSANGYVSQVRRGYQYDSAGRVTAEWAGSGIDTLVPSVPGQLYASGELAYSFYGYDAFGNRTTDTTLVQDESYFGSHDTVWSGRTTIFDKANRVIGVRTQEYGEEKWGLLVQVAYGYDMAGNQILESRLKDADQLNLGNYIDTWSDTKRQFDANGNVIAQIDPYNTRTEFAYDRRNNCTETRFAVGTAWARKTNASYDKLDRKTGDYLYANDLSSTVNAMVDSSTTTDASGAATLPSAAYTVGTTYKYDGLGRLIKSTNALNRSAHYYYNAWGQLSTEVNEVGDITTYKYNSQGQTKEVRQWLTQYGSVSSLPDYGAPTPVESRNDQTGELRDRVATMEYNKAGQLSAQVTADGNRTEITYTSAGQKKKEVHFAQLANASDRRTVTYWYNSLGQQYRRFDADGSETWFRYDGAGNTTRVTVYLNTDTDNIVRETRYTYDGNNRKLTEELYHGNTMSVDPGNTTVSIGGAELVGKQRFAYDAAGNLVGLYKLVAVTEDGEVEQRITYGYDLNNRVISEKQGDLNAIQYFYDRAGNRSKTVDGGGNVTWFSYNKTNQLIQTQQVGNGNGTGAAIYGGVDVYDYATGTTSSVKSATKNTYDAAGRLVESEDANGNKTTYYYDHAGHKIGERDADNVWRRYLYNAFGDLTETWESKVRISSSTARTYGFDVVASLDTQVTAAQFRKTKYEYNKRGQLTKVTYPPVTVTTLNNVDQPESVSATDSANQTLSETSTYDVYGNRIETTDRAGNKSFFWYDAAGRCIASLDAEGYLIERDYDQQGNVLKERVYTWDLNDSQKTVLTGSRPATWPKPTFMGVPSPVHETIREYDAANRLVQETSPEFESFDLMKSDEDDQIKVSHRQTSFDYDLAGNLIGKTYSSQYKNSTGTGWIQTSDKQFEAWSYDASGRQVMHRDTAGVVTTLWYNSAGNLELRARLYGRRTPTGLPLQPTLAEINAVRDSLVFRDQSKDQLTGYTYNERNQLETEFDSVNGQYLTKTYRYDKAGNRTYIEDEEGNVTKMVYDGKNRLKETTDPSETTTTLSYDTGGRTISAVVHSTDVPAGAATSITITYQYDDLGQLIGTDEQNGVWRTLGHDKNGAVVSEIQTASGNTIDLYRVVDKRGRTVQEFSAKVTTGIGVEQRPMTTYHYDAYNHIKQIDAPEGRMVRYTYNGLGEKVTEEVKVGEEANGIFIFAETHYYYDGAGRVVGVSRPRGSEMIRTVQFAPDGDPEETVEIKAGQLGLANFTHDVRDYMQRNFYDYDGRLVLTVDDSGVMEGYTLDCFGRRVEKIDGRGLEASSVDQGKVVIKEWAADHIHASYVTRYTYDRRDRLTSMIEPLADQLCWDDSWVARETRINLGFSEHADDLSDTARTKLTQLFTVSYTYDKRNNRTQTTRKTLDVDKNVVDAQVIQQVYNWRGQVTDTYIAPSAADLSTANKSGAWSDPYPYNPVTHSRTVYDGFGRVRRKTDEENHTQGFIYDAKGRLIERQDADGVNTHFQYDGFGRMWFEYAFAEGDAPPYSKYITKGYDDAGHVTYIDDDMTDVRTDYIYRKDGLLKRETVTGYLALRGINDLGYENPGANGTTQLEYRDTQYQYDAAGRMTGWWDLSDTLNSLDDSDHMLTVDPIGVYTRYDLDGNKIETYTSNGWHREGGDVASGYHELHHLYSFDLNGRVVMEKNRVYSLETGQAVKDTVLEWTYDAANNRTSEVVEGKRWHYTNTDGTSSIDANNRLTKARTSANSAAKMWRYDSRGNLLRSYGVAAGTGPFDDSEVTFHSDGNVSAEMAIREDFKEFSGYDANNHAAHEDYGKTDVYNYYDRAGRLRHKETDYKGSVDGESFTNRFEYSYTYAHDGRLLQVDYQKFVNGDAADPDKGQGARNGKIVYVYNGNKELRLTTNDNVPLWNPHPNQEGPASWDGQLVERYYRDNSGHIIQSQKVMVTDPYAPGPTRTVQDASTFLYANGNPVGEVKYSFESYSLTQNVLVLDGVVTDYAGDDLEPNGRDYSMIKAAGSTAGGVQSYTVQGGESLQDVAERVYGDRSLWYTLAETNGMSGSEALHSGQQLRLPNSDKVGGLTANTHQTYNEGSILENLAVTQISPPRPSTDNCAMMAGIVIAVVVAVAVSAATYGAASQIGLAAGGAVAAGTMSATAATAVTIGGSAVAGAAIAAVGVGVRVGLQSAVGLETNADSFWQEVAGGAVAGATMGIGAAGDMLKGAKLIGDVGSTYMRVAQASVGTANAVTSQFLFNQRGQDFSWGNVISSGISGGASVYGNTTVSALSGFGGSIGSLIDGDVAGAVGNMFSAGGIGLSQSGNRYLQGAICAGGALIAGAMDGMSGRLASGKEALYYQQHAFQRMGQGIGGLMGNGALAAGDFAYDRLSGNYAQRQADAQQAYASYLNAKRARAAQLADPEYQMLHGLGVFAPRASDFEGPTTMPQTGLGKGRRIEKSVGEQAAGWTNAKTEDSVGFFNVGESVVTEGDGGQVVTDMFNNNPDGDEVLYPDDPLVGFVPKDAKPAPKPKLKALGGFVTQQDIYDQVDREKQLKILNDKEGQIDEGALLVNSSGEVDPMLNAYLTLNFGGGGGPEFGSAQWMSNLQYQAKQIEWARVESYYNLLPPNATAEAVGGLLLGGLAIGVGILTLPGTLVVGGGLATYGLIASTLGIAGGVMTVGASAVGLASRATGQVDNSGLDQLNGAVGYAGSLANPMGLAGAFAGGIIQQATGSKRDLVGFGASVGGTADALFTIGVGVKGAYDMRKATQAAFREKRPIIDMDAEDLANLKAMFGDVEGAKVPSRPRVDLGLTADDLADMKARLGNGNIFDPKTWSYHLPPGSAPHGVDLGLTPDDLAGIRAQLGDGSIFEPRPLASGGELEKASKAQNLAWWAQQRIGTKPPGSAVAAGDLDALSPELRHIFDPARSGPKPTFSPNGPLAAQHLAAWKIANRVNPASIAKNTEMGGMILRNVKTGEIITTHEVYGAAAAVRPKGNGFTRGGNRLVETNAKLAIPPGYEHVADWHSHGADVPGFENNRFSPADYRVARSQERPLYLFAPDGTMHYYQPGHRPVQLGTIETALNPNEVYLHVQDGRVDGDLAHQATVQMNASRADHENYVNNSPFVRAQVPVSRMQEQLNAYERASHFFGAIPPSP